jgi:hypothetical protein
MPAPRRLIPRAPAALAAGAAPGPLPGAPKEVRPSMPLALFAPVLQIIAPVFLVIAIGWLSARTGEVDAGMTRALAASCSVSPCPHWSSPP